jgi:hypothetical protein
MVRANHNSKNHEAIREKRERERGGEREVGGEGGEE